MKNEIKKELIWLPEELVKKLKKIENEAELEEKLVLKYIDDTKRDISSEIENLDEDVLCFKAKLLTYKKELKEAYTENENQIIKLWENLEERRTKFYKNGDRIKDDLRSCNNDYDNLLDKADKLYNKFKDIDLYRFEKVKSFLESYDSLSSETKESFERIIKDTK